MWLSETYVIVLQYNFLLNTNIQSLVWENNAVDHHNFIFYCHWFTWFMNMFVSYLFEGWKREGEKLDRRRKTSVLSTKNGNPKLRVVGSWGLKHEW